MQKNHVTVVNKGRDRVIEAASAHVRTAAPDWVWNFIAKVQEQRHEFTAEDIRLAIGNPPGIDPRCTGGLMRKIRSDKMAKITGRTIHAKTNHGRVRVWERMVPNV